MSNISTGAHVTQAFKALERVFEEHDQPAPSFGIGATRELFDRLKSLLGHPVPLAYELLYGRLGGQLSDLPLFLAPHPLHREGYLSYRFIAPSELGVSMAELMRGGLSKRLPFAADQHGNFLTMSTRGWIYRDDLGDGERDEILADSLGVYLDRLRCWWDARLQLETARSLFEGALEVAVGQVAERLERLPGDIDTHVRLTFDRVGTVSGFEALVLHQEGGEPVEISGETLILTRSLGSTEPIQIRT